MVYRKLSTCSASSGRVADVFQRDEHDEQMILFTNPVSKLDHVVLIDDASTTQTWEPTDPNFIDNYFGLLYTLLGGRGDIGFDYELVWKHFGEPDDWDSVMAFIPTVFNGQEMKHVEVNLSTIPLYARWGYSILYGKK
ncbi:hypothetical protein D9757_006839 [Collybiopsis confluens]|uniref:Uncharacterized protein n=1 Tax=Collybiopsis confluens TaxID=2823264 RepID=A0A8H5MAU2_9AGAR|nr:hypothetical protein D9757_006839 [Collybiopsis confluens]